MAQVKFFGTEINFQKNRNVISEAVHKSLVEIFLLPQEKRFHRFISFSPADFIYPEDRSSNYTIIEISIFEGRSTEIKKQLIKKIFYNLENEAQINPTDVEITIFETPRANWGIRGFNGDEINLPYKVNL